MCCLSNAQYARITHQYLNTKGKSLRTNAAIWFNTMCRLQHVTPTYIQIKTFDNQHINTYDSGMRASVVTAVSTSTYLYIPAMLSAYCYRIESRALL